MEAHRLAAWRDEFIALGVEGLKATPASPGDRRLKEAERKIGELTLENETLAAAATKKGGFRSRPGSGRSERRAPSAPGHGVSGAGLASLNRLCPPGGVAGGWDCEQARTEDSHG